MKKKNFMTLMRENQSTMDQDMADKALNCLYDYYLHRQRIEKKK